MPAAGGSDRRAVSLLAAVLTTDSAGLPLRDPDHVAGRRLALVLGLVAVLVAVDVVVRARRRSRAAPAVAGGARERPPRALDAAAGLAVGSALICFYVTYLAYRNLKSVVPLLRPGDLFDEQLADVDRRLSSATIPPRCCTSLVGTGVATHFMSAAYMLFFLFIPGTLAVALVFSRNLQHRSLLRHRAVAQLAARRRRATSCCRRSGPIYLDRPRSRSSPGTGVGRLQEILLEQRVEFLRDPALGTAQSIGAFASLHVSIFFTAALAAHLLGLARRVRVAAWCCSA